jgi:hypothetical protein
MNDKDFTDMIQYTKEISNSGRIRHRAKLEFFTEYYQDIDSQWSESSIGMYEDLIKDRMAKELHRHIYGERKESLGRAIDKLLSCVEPYFLPSEKLLEARDEVLKAAGYKPGNRLAS